VKTWLMHETKIGKYLYPLRAIAGAMLLGAVVALVTVEALVRHALGL
jgi:hypothetical protein